MHAIKMHNQAIFLAFLVVYVVVTMVLFHFVYQASQLVVDEEFHLIQGEHYCRGRFGVWDNKITTFPGLYLVSAGFLGPYRLCSVFALRMTSVVASIANAYLIFIIRKVVAINRGTAYLMLESISLATLPPLYFFSHLYYTDVISVTMVLMMVYLNLRAKYHWAALSAGLAIMMRQTNVIWVGFVLGCQLTNVTLYYCLEADRRPQRSKQRVRHYTLMDLWTCVKIMIGQPKIIVEVFKHASLKFPGYELNLLGFLVFLFTNGSIVVGDRTAHQAAIHLPQILYFTLFFAAFSSSHVAIMLHRTLRFMLKRWYVTILCLAAIGAIVHYNTIVHPYMLADNRHYTFYIWNRFYGRYWWARYAPVPLYYCLLVMVGLMVFSKSTGTQIGQQSHIIGFKIFWIVALLASVGLQQLIEVRYFIVPFLILRLIQNSIKTNVPLLAFELAVNLIINAVTFYIFFTKEIFWTEYHDPQRIIW
ncbi:putative Dol-P-Glc:Glc(2)Man(9)GlcNAc(2)-PP-Dol alpha-1,2-glucosyltransferase [Uranotaenia lowii]|uniref:putative Dol-P-Glc:Glc(2)Man(9)GlcNAc(2)-PP-Dol alpha-1,2-glucosyltransferase n=1 Tax=Uranotaenia lowii TaxID=190385 RepID=UPI0024793F5A|nr:putative Dol-P-Glc:Glc(2)Man(9)GlcNAc(2)-PP-Dol alpha-1,2-glucosyltransferase [Uranotaenia lowii]